ncbi:MAG: transcriptional repressor [Sedimentisphaerales bacterium]|nr:transcriptional repressor [Sedimentisphaerales bacterium]
MTVSRIEVDRRVQAFVQTCRRRGLKITHQRMAIFQELAASAVHPDAESVFQAVSKPVPGISRDTVYRTLATLETEGLVRRVEPLVESSRYDANLDRHHHFVCTVCGMVSDFYSAPLDRLPIPKSLESVGRIDSAQVQVRGTCLTCMNRTIETRQRRPQ